MKATYFFPERTPDGHNYWGYATIPRTGVRTRVQLPQEGIYTPFEIRQLDQPPPGVWRTCDTRDTGYIFGLRQFFGDELPPEVPAP